MWIAGCSNGMSHYCNIWKLEVNAQKTKVVIFGSKKNKSVPDYSLGGEKIEVVSQYTYLGVLFKSNGNMKDNVSVMKNMASRAMFALLTQARNLNLDTDVQLHLFDSMVCQ